MKREAVGADERIGVVIDRIVDNINDESDPLEVKLQKVLHEVYGSDMTDFVTDMIRECNTCVHCENLSSPMIRCTIGAWANRQLRKARKVH